jgi:hypothetical protein
MAAWTPSSLQRLLNAFMQSRGIESSVPISGSAAMISAKRFENVSTRCFARLGRAAAYNVTFVCKINFLLFHGTKNDLEGVQQVVEDGDLPLFPLG